MVRYYGVPTENFYPRPPRGGRHLRMSIALQHIFISIHALLAEGDIMALIKVKDVKISIHALLAEGDCSKQMVDYAATISIHALLAEGDFQCVVDFVELFKFLSTPSSRRATKSMVYTEGTDLISIHALLAEGDPV